MNLCYEEVFSLLLPQKEKGYCDTRRQMKTKYYELEARYERKCEEVQTNFSSSSSRELDLMFSTLQNWRETLIAHKREHYSECSQLIFKHATEFDDFVAKYHTAQFKLNFDDSLSRDLQYACHDAYLDLYNGSIDPEMLSEAFWTLVESWDSSRVAIFTDGQTHPDFSQLPSTYDEPRPTATVKALEEVPRTSESSVNDSQMSSAHTRRHSGLSPHESRNRVQTTRSQTPSETPPGLEGSALITLPETPKERIIERSMSIPGLDDWQAQIPFLSGEMREERRTCNPVVNIHIKGEEIPSPDVSAAHILPDPIPISSPIPITPATPNPYPSTPSRKHGSPRVIREVRRTTDSTSESRNASERVQLTRSQTCPSSLKPDSLLVPRELQRNSRSSLTDNELSKARKDDFLWKSPSKSPMETVTTVSRTLSKPSTCVESRRLSEPVQKLPVKGKPKGVVHGSPRSRAVIAATSCAPSSGAVSYSNPQTGNTAVSITKQVNTSKYAPSTMTALTLSKHSPVSSIRAHPSNRLTHEPNPTLSNVSKRRIPSVVNTKQMVKKETHQKNDARSKASIPTANRQFGLHSEQPIQAVKPLGSPPGLPEKIPECSEERSILFGQLASEQVNSLSQFGETGEERLVLDAVMSIQKENNEYSLPETSAALTLPIPIPITSPIHPDHLRHSPSEGIHSQAINEANQRVSTPETQNALERVQLTRSEASPSSAKSDNPPELPGFNTSPLNTVHEPTLARIPVSVKSVPEMVLPISRPLLSASIHTKAVKRSIPTGIPNIRELPKGNSLAGVKPFGRIVSAPSPKRRDVEKPTIGKTKVNLTKGTTNAVKHLPAPKTASLLSKPSTVLISSTRASSTCPSITRPSKDRISPPSLVVSKRRASSVVSTNYVVNNNTTHHLSETLSRVSNGSLSPPFGENPPSPVAGEATLFVEPQGEPSCSPEACERSAECSTQTQRLVGARVLTLSLSDEVKEKRRIYDTVVSIQMNRSEENIPEDTASRMLPLSTSIPSSICAVPTAPIRPLPDEPSPPVEVVPRRHILNVVNKKSSASELLHSPYPGTARRQSQQRLAPSRNEGEQLARAAAYIRERISRRSLTRDESVCCSSKVPPDKAADPDSDSGRLNTRVVNKETEMSVRIRSPESEGSESPPVQSDTVPQQLKTRRAEELSSEYSEAIPWLPGPVFDEASSRWQRNLHAVSNVEMSMSSRSPKPESEPSPFLSETGRSFQPKPPELPVSRLGSSKRCSLDIVNNKFGLNTSQCSPELAVVLTPPMPIRASQTFAFDFSCSLDMLSRMMRVLRVITCRAIRNPKAEEMQYTIILEHVEDDRTPSSASSYIYIDTGTTANAVPFIPPKPSRWAETPGSVCVDLTWRARCKPPNFAVDSRRQSYLVVNKMNNPGDEYSPLCRAVRILPKPSNLLRTNHLRLRRLLKVDISRLTSVTARPPCHRRSFASFVVVFLRYLRIDSEG